ncbi:hypothetical protein APHAL10511_003139 [Amanita phalloides]|nr:hypothetical protein APHAL10511_003139 [Amanita phalloides]
MDKLKTFKLHFSFALPLYLRLTCLTIDSLLKGLGKAYTQDFIGDFATKFIKHLEQAEWLAGTSDGWPLYAKAIFVVQSSGTGKSRMLTESTDLGYPPGDKPVIKFFSAMPQFDVQNSLTAHIAIACFLAAAHQIMLETLQEACKEKGLDGPPLLEYWHALMELTGVRDR